MPGLVPGQGWRWNGLTSGKILAAHDYRNEAKRWYGLLSDLDFFLVGGPSSSTRSGGAISDIGCMVPQPFAAGVNQLYLEFWAITGDSRYPGY
jgi:hypothetical protein